MDDPVTDVVIVAEPHNCPDGYTVLRECPCGHEAQLWEKVRGGLDNTRYLCFTKKPLSTDKEKDMVIESLYIPGPGVQYLMPYYEVIAKTVEGQREPLRHKQLALKKVRRSQAKKVVADIVVARGKDSISKKFIKLEKINGVRICFRQEEYSKSSSPTRPSHTMDDMVISTKNVSLDNHRFRAQTVTPKDMRGTSLPAESEERPSMPKSAYPSSPSLTATKGNISPTAQPVVEELVTVKLVQSLASTPSPLVPTLPTDQPPTNHPPQRDPQPSGQPFEKAPPSQYPPAPSSGYQGSQYPPPAGYPQPAGYHPQAYTQPGGYPLPYGQPGRFPYAAPPTTVGYDTSIGFSFGGGGSTYPPPPSQYPASPYGEPSGSYPPPYPPAATPNQPTYPPGGPSTNSSNPSYGFNL